MLGRKVVVRWMFSFGGFYQDDLRYYTIRVHCYSLWNHRGTQSLVWKRGRANHTPLPLQQEIGLDRGVCYGRPSTY